MAWIDQATSAGQSGTDINTSLQQGNQILAQLVQLFSDLFPRSVGSFTMDAAASKAVTDGNVTSSSAIVLIPSNASAAVLQGSNECLYPTPASGTFTVATGAGTSAAGTETFKYLVFNPL